MITDTLTDKNIFLCKNCERIINEISELMRPEEAFWVQTCIAEILEYEGHMNCERFLKLYRRGLFANKPNTKAEAVRGVLRTE